MFSAEDGLRLSNILFASENDDEHIEKSFQCDYEKSGVWKRNVRQYKILSIDQIVALEEFFIARQLPVTKTNIKHASKALKIPYQRSVDYMYRKYSKAQENANDFYQQCISEFDGISRSIERCWDLYLEGCKAYDGFSRNGCN
ncbi:hypothetical protein HK407_01g00530 [Ordospora pajunii]|uniref:uncharacterized protein n=1 Tax=Ordospora pajunii TaxID=3039483 RepID=UPI0029528665|nr:uncharacterized protein HK407_01g00530 [Ordospora pajunii]KAH9412161.1 hypothetical protein HK407_01g00530 [Ordospora pajunii]